MKPEEQRIAIAEACPEIFWIEPGSNKIFYAWWGICDREIIDGEDYPDPIDFLGDLNAIHEAVDTLLFSQRQVYYDNLRLVCSQGLPEGCYVADIECSHATAAQRAEAFLRTLNLWKD